ncbi:Peroxiredoxin [Mesobacillus persicus]|uniref:Peroxiredoxin n=1 Tax=Mesobacillus persicus TaxID=930146 RepID=A0A1H7Z9T3_9BACI|nr:TlpA disulfide reductase family protein [Mesobacillus persicus]SEM54308.1 Peroxiredoxin [Mesobacillus persicus]
MNKNLLSIAIILLAVAIVFVNLWKPSSIESEKEVAEPSTEELDPTSEEIPGADLSEVKEGKAAPDFELTTPDGETVKLSDYQGKKVILNFWATWCPPCKAEMPHMQDFYEKNKENDIEILAVNLTNMDKGQAAIEEFVTDYGLTFEIPLDEDGSIGMQYQAFSIPTSYMIDTNGVITKKIVGPMDGAMMENLTAAME